ncbi:hypothetical protein BV25DRAFT_932126 [Artomyces pyxidatus]|uniref:Uncharacterized protein n=1 Tax=Artomyces pyxidatus TaxID=48021 RepID=A0ACB8SXC8_9AGAM|nr:hypothetical protein BV25DRAFT_932126 [Artomyces pyxidatus]
MSPLDIALLASSCLELQNEAERRPGGIGTASRAVEQDKNGNLPSRALPLRPRSALRVGRTPTNQPYRAQHVGRRLRSMSRISCISFASASAIWLWHARRCVGTCTRARNIRLGLSASRIARAHNVRASISRVAFMTLRHASMYLSRVYCIRQRVCAHRLAERRQRLGGISAALVERVYDSGASRRSVTRKHHHLMHKHLRWKLTHGCSLFVWRQRFDGPCAQQLPRDREARS